MYFVNSFIGAVIILSVIVVRCDDIVDDPPAINETLYGAGNCCYFAFDTSIITETMQESTPNAKAFAFGIIPNQRMEFANYPTYPEAVYTTTVDDPNRNVYGRAFLIPTAEYEAFVKEDTMYNGQRVGRSVREKITVTMGGVVATIDCNALLSVGQALVKPPKWLITDLVAAFTEVGFSQDYITYINSLPTAC